MARAKAAAEKNGVSDKPKCLTCERKAINRGLCRGCYMAAYRSVNAKETNWPKLEKAGLALAKGSLRRPGRFKKAMQGK